jgi:hypothetical protein
MWKKFRWVALAIFALLVLWVVVDLSSVRRVNIREFDPDEVARLDNAMWRSYYAKEPVRMFFQLAELLRSQYHFPYFKSHIVAYRAAEAAFIFKKGSSRADYELALPDLVHYYMFLHDISTTPFNVDRAAQLELEWWIVHRQRAQHQAGNLDRAVAESAAEFYGVSSDNLMEYAHYRSEAMTIRDSTAEHGSVTEDDWGLIESLLHRAYRSLWQNLHN